VSGRGGSAGAHVTRGSAAEVDGAAQTSEGLAIAQLHYEDAPDDSRRR
jgi:hypothetical protein